MHARCAGHAFDRQFEILGRAQGGGGTHGGNLQWASVPNDASFGVAMGGRSSPCVQSLCGRAAA